MCFTGIDTYINIYINIYDSIFLSPYGWRLHGLYDRHVYSVHGFCTPNSAASGKKKNAFFVPLTTFADKKDGNFSVKPHETLKESRGWGGRLRLIELLLKKLYFLL